jgi:histidinol dehydrogenase
MEISINLKPVRWSPQSRGKTVDEFLSRPALPPAAEKVAAEVLADIVKNGDRAVAKYAKKFDRVTLVPKDFRVPQATIDAAEKQVDAKFKRAAREAYKRVTAFAKAGMRPDWSMPTPQGGTVGERFLPLDRVGAYIPGGTAPLASTAIMTLALAKAAGVKEIVAFSPSNSKGELNPYILYAMKLAGATEVYRIGGIQSIVAAAYGTESIPAVQKIVGPGNAYVTAAKKLVFGKVAIDMLAGPSEIAVLDDGSVPAAFVAADLLSQAEHGWGL